MDLNITTNYLKKFLFRNKSTKQVVLKNIFWLLFSEGFNKSLMLLLTILIARYLGVAEYGKFTFALSFASLFVIIVDLGLNTLSIREIAKDNKLAKIYFYNIVSIKIIFSVIAFILILISTSFMEKGSVVKSYIYLFGIYLILNNFNDFFRAIFRAFERMEYEAFSKIAQVGCTFFIALFFLKYSFPIIFCIQSYILGSVLSIIILIFFLFKKINLNFKLKFDFILPLIKKSWPFALIGIVTLIHYPLINIQLKFLSNSYEVGIYSAAFNIISIIILFIVLLNNSFFPTISKIHHQSNNNFFIAIKKLSAKIILISMILCIIIFISSPWIINILYGNQFVDSIILLRILSISVFILSGSTVVAFSFLIINPIKYLILYSFGVFVNFIMNFQLIESYGAFGAALGTLISSTLISITFLYTFKKLKTKHYNIHRFENG